MSDQFYLKCWGARGSTPTPGASTLRYGGETTCFEIRAGDSLVMVDCGSGARNLGFEICDATPIKFDLLFTHTHLDHICGLPFFKPAFHPNYQVNAWAGHFEDNSTSLSDIVSRIMSPPIFPLAAKSLKGLSFLTFEAGQPLPRDDGLVIHTMRLNHPGGACGYRLEFNGKSICIITDHEHGNPEVDAALPDFVRNADIMIYDAMFTDDEYETYKGWGHSTWQKAVELAGQANVKTPVLFHHDPRRSDDELDEIGMAASAAYPGTLVASEGMVLRP
ncbi:phosphoribosyl 1,2-cyclic phosphodiesterase [Roseibium hamelinense]|uniref:Phosphoribosyl 1,2-cyclic phosphodiesterase n=1 Tax=Roseibium hamelinense TaxID=150831 RepID=A0A562T7H8_9HYPH|nr:MBL fold metallo-hydrolase [Roseibium hamelinense]TWI89442.1 phosphoribosyl 1,2-cyclic phosphodiesterase [Roseibium hamelinense]